MALISKIILYLLAFIGLYEIVESGIVYHGSVKENAKVGDKVEIDKPLYVRNRSRFFGEEVCGYTIHKALSDLPFRIVLLEPFSGGASIVVDGKLDFEQQQKYLFQVSAHDCEDSLNTTHSERERVEINIEDVNDNPPRWIDSFYSVSVSNLIKKHQQIVCLQITDDDISQGFSDICTFFLYDSTDRFYIDNKGCIYNKEVLVSPMMIKVPHQLKVFAKDCGGLMTEGVDVHVEWVATCTYYWKGYERNVEISEFGKNSTLLALLEGIELDKCSSNNTCDIGSMSVTLRLSSGVDGGCRRDEDSFEAQRTLCGSSGETTFTAVQNETEFDGNSTFMEIPAESIKIDGQFLISVWMKRNKSSDDSLSGRRDKEQILCNSDDSKIIRRHYMWYVEGCKAVFVMRRSDDNDVGGGSHDNSGDDDDDEKVESQWEWNVPELCDGNWHHYVVSSVSSSMELYVDGRVYTTSKNDLRISRKWKLHPLSHPPSSRVVIGACWMGRHERMEELFQGWLAGLTVTTNHTNCDQVIKCLSECHERLTLEKIDNIQSGTFVMLSEDKLQLTVNSTTTLVIRDILGNVDLLLPSPHPVPGPRTLSISTNIICKNSEVVSFDSNDIVVSMSLPHPLKITTNQVVTVDELNLIEGVKILEEFYFVIQDSESESEKSIEMCFVRSDSAMDLNKEMFLFDDRILRDLDLQVDLTNHGLFVGKVGAEPKNISSYEEFLKLLKYSNKAWSPWQRRSFIIGCLDSNEQLLTNHIKVLLQATIHLPEPMPANHIIKNELAVEQQKIRKESITSNRDDATNIGFWLPIFLVVCAGLVITLGILGVSKLKERRGEQHADMEWDHSEMSIAVNPLYEMDDLNSADQSEIFDDNDGGDDDEGEEGNVDESGTSEETRRDLEWDDLPY